MAFSVILGIIKEILIMSGHAFILEISVVINVVNDKTFLFSMAVSSNFSEHFGGFSWEHRSIDDFDESSWWRHFVVINVKFNLRGKFVLNRINGAKKYFTYVVIRVNIVYKSSQRFD
jgi:hypothetical protein